MQFINFLSIWIKFPTRIWLGTSTASFPEERLTCRWIGWGKIKQEVRQQSLKWAINFFLDLLLDLRRLKLIVFFNISITLKRFYLACRAYKEFLRKTRLSKRIYGFCESDCQEFPLTELFELGKEVSEEFPPLIKRKAALCFHLSMRSWRSSFSSFCQSEYFVMSFTIDVEAKLPKDANTVQDFLVNDRDQIKKLDNVFIFAILILSNRFWHPLFLCLIGQVKAKKDRS